MHHFHTNLFQLQHWKTCKILKSPLLKRSQHRFSSQGCFKTMFSECRYGQTLIEIDLNTLPQFPKNDFKLVTEKLARNWKMLFSNAQNILFWAKGTLKTIFWEAYYEDILSYSFDKKAEKFPSECLKHYFLNSRYLEHDIVKSFLWPIHALTSFERLLHFPRKWFQLRHSKIFKKLKISLFQRSEHSFVSSR